MHRKAILILPLLGLVYGGMPSFVSAQSIWMDRDGENLLWLEAIQPNTEEFESSFTTSVIYLGGQWAFSDSFRLVGELPFVYYTYDSPFESATLSENALGNPYLGLSYQKQDSPFRFDLGLHAPLADDGADGSGLYIGLLTDFVDRAEAFATNLIPMTFLAHYNPQFDSGLSLRLTAGTVMDLDLDDDFGDSRVETFVLYKAQALYELEHLSKLRFGAGLSGRFWATAGESIEDDSKNLLQLGLNTSIGVGRFRPGFQVRVPLNGVLEELSGPTFALNLGFKL